MGPQRLFMSIEELQKIRKPTNRAMNCVSIIIALSDGERINEE
jgi:hypothetical protein